RAQRRAVHPPLREKGDRALQDLLPASYSLGVRTPPSRACASLLRHPAIVGAGPDRGGGPRDTVDAVLASALSRKGGAMIRTHSRYVIIGAGIHGLATAWHLARELRARGLGGGEDILVLDKRGAGAGASGIACGTVRNNYFQPAMRELMAHSVSVWESDPDAFSYHPVGFLQVAPEAMSEDVAQIYSEQQAIGYPSVLIEGKADCQRYLLDMFEDWQAPGSTTVLHEKKGGYAKNIRAVRGLGGKGGGGGGGGGFGA